MNGKKAQLSKLGTSILAVAGAIIVFVMLLIIIQGINGTIDRTSHDATANVLTATTQTLDESPVSITTTAQNQTWLEFDGSTDRINFTSGNIAGSSSSTSCAWVNISSLTTPTTQAIITNNRYQLQAGNFNSRYAFTSDGGANYAVAATNSVVTGIWQFICAKRNETGATTLYVNGIVSGSANQNSGTPTNNSVTNLYIGNRQSLGTVINGSIDDSYIWNKELDFNQMRQLYNESLHGNGLGKGVPILQYHCVGTDNPCGNSQVHEDNFTAQMRYLNESGFTTITLIDYYQWVRNNYTLPKKPIILTFDDGWDSVINVAYPIMRNFSFVGDLAIPTGVGYINYANRMNWSNVSYLRNQGWGVSSHSVNHDNLTSMALSQRIIEFNQSRWDIYNNISYLPLTWVYPYNLHNITTDSECGDFYELCTGDLGTVNSWSYKSYNLTGGVVRVSVTNGTDIETYKTRINLEDKMILHQKFDENNGTIAHDLSSNGNNGTISGATWNDDGISNTLTQNIDYSTSAETFTLLNPEYAWTQLNLSYSYVRDTVASRSGNVTLVGFATLGSFISIIVLAVVAAVILGLLFGVFGIRRAR